MSNIQLFQSPSAKSLEDIIGEAYASFGVPSLGGASKDGWSKLADFQRCPYRYWLNHVRQPNTTDLVQIGPKPVALELGALFHAMLACHYIGGVTAVTASYPTALELVNRVESLGGNKEITDEANRLYLAYFNHYGNPHNEGIKPLAVELPAGKEGVHTCRFDLLANVERLGGTWIVEHKTASRESRDVLEGWWNDGEIIGEVLGYKLSGLEKVYGPLAGVCVNIVIKTKEPKFRRVDVVVSDATLERYLEDSAYWRTLRGLSATNNQWPRKLQGCIGRYDTCQHWDHCRDANATDSDRLVRLLEGSLK